MPVLGIYTQAQYLGLGQERRFLGARVAYNLLDVGERPTEELIRVFEDVSFTLRTSNGTFRTSFRSRFRDVDAAAVRWMQTFWPADAALSIEDRAASHALTSCEWAQSIAEVFPGARFEASDRLLHIFELSLDNGEVYMADLDGVGLQYIKPPWVVSIHHPESWRNPLLRYMASVARRRFARLELPVDWMETGNTPHGKVRRISCVHPEAAALAAKSPRFTVRARSVFERTPAACHVIRTMNILNRSYFPDETLAEGARAIFNSLQPGGIWIVGRTLEEDLSNHVTFLRRNDRSWEVLDRIGTGSEIEELALRAQEARA
jgi:hypothetical protein